MTDADAPIYDRLRQILREQGSLAGDIDQLTPLTDLFAAGLTSLASVDLMLAIEQRFGLMFPDDALNRRTFSSIAAIAEVIKRLTAGAAP